MGSFFSPSKSEVWSHFSLGKNRMCARKMREEGKRMRGTRRSGYRS
jgi:hypothetical protein